MHFGTLIIAYGMLICSIFNQIINSWPNRTALNYTYKQQLFDIFQNGVIGLVMGIVIYSIRWLGFNNFFTLILQIVIGASVYIVISILSKNSSFCYILSIIELTKNRKEGKK